MMKNQHQDQQRIRAIGTRDEAINRCLSSLIHAISCRDGPACNANGCLKMKRVVEHTKICPRKTYGGCTICKQLIALCCHHSKSCRQSVCHVPFCRILKRKLQQAATENEANQQRLQR